MVHRAASLPISGWSELGSSRVDQHSDVPLTTCRRSRYPILAWLGTLAYRDGNPFAECDGSFQRRDCPPATTQPKSVAAGYCDIPNSICYCIYHKLFGISNRGRCCQFLAVQNEWEMTGCHRETAPSATSVRGTPFAGSPRCTITE